MKNSDKIVIAVQIFSGLLFSGVGAYGLLIDKNMPLPFALIFLFLGLMVLANGLWTWKPKKVPEFIVGIPISAVFFYVGYLVLNNQNPAGMFEIHQSTVYDMLTVPVEISADAMKYSMALAFIVVGTIPWLWKYYISAALYFLKRFKGPFPTLFLLYFIVTFFFLLFPAFYMVIVEENMVGLSILFNWFIMLLIIFVGFVIMRIKDMIIK